MVSTTALPIQLVEQEWADRVPSPAHDALTPAMRRHTLEHNPYSYLGVTRSRDDLADQTTMTDDQLLHAGRAALGSLLAAKVFSPPGASRYLVYRLTTDFHVQTGIVCGVATDDFESGLVKVHEQIHPERAIHLSRHFEIVGAQSSPIAVAHTPNDEIADIIELVTTTSIAAVTVSGDDGLVQQVWPVDDTATIDQITAAFAEQPLYLIDGHHRASAASQFRKNTGDPEADWTLCALFSTEELANFPHHRTLPPSVGTSELLDAIRAVVPVRELDGDHPLDGVADDELIIYRDGGWFGVVIGNDENAPPSLASLDQQRLENLIDRLGRETAPAVRSAIRYRPGILPPTALAAEIDMLGGCLFLMRQVSMDQLLAVADAGLTMPPKSTYFEPKVRSGVFFRPCLSTFQP